MSFSHLLMITNIPLKLEQTHFQFSQYQCETAAFEAEHHRLLLQHK